MQQHRQQNIIFSLKDNQGNCLTQKEEMERLLIQHFKGIIIETQSNREEEIAKISQYIPRRVNRAHNMALLWVITKKEVEEIAKIMAKNKAPGPDGYTTKFFQATWSFMKKDIVNFVEESRCTKKMHPAWNVTFLALILKLEKADEAQGFRPIALCNVIYKILATIMVNRLKYVLPELISEEQIGFVRGRQIVDEIIVAQEAIHSLKNSRHEGMMIKLDLAKAYDKLSWEYL